MRPVEKIIDRLEGVKRSGDSGRQWVALCPAHEDAHHSLAIGVGSEDSVVLRCYAGCEALAILQALGLGWADLYPERDDGPPPVTTTVEMLALHKRLPVEFLTGEECRLRDVRDGKGVEIPYAGQPKGAERPKVIAWKKRTTCSAKHGSKWPAGQELVAYGLWKLPRWRSEGVTDLAVVEGESDCWTLWHHGIAAVGIPGSGAAKTLTRDVAEGFGRLVVWREPDAGGDALIRGLTKQLAAIEYAGAVVVIQNTGAVKDANVLHQRDPEGFKTAWAELVAKAEPLDFRAKPADQNGHKKNGRHPKPSRTPIPAVVAATEAETKRNGPTPTPGHYGFTDLGNCQRLVFRHGLNIRYCHPWKTWVAWGGTHWTTDATGFVMQKAVETVRSIYSEAGEADSQEMREKTSAHAIKSESAKSIQAMVLLARYDRSIDVDFRQFNNDPWLLNCRNGTVDLHTGELLTHRREHLITKCADATYDPAAECPAWEKFLRDVFAGDGDLVTYVQRLCGYFLTADVSTHMLPVFWGCGGNGKGTLLNTLLGVMGSGYSGAAASELLMTRHGHRHPTELADLHGKRLVVCQETDDGCRLNEPLVKWLTGGDQINARRMCENFWTFDPTHKLVLSTNYRPKVHGTDRGIWRRLRLVPFNVTFDGEREDTKLSDRLESESAGILAWMVAGCLAWQRHGENTPEAVLVATSEYQQEEDIVRRFVTDRCVTDHPDLESRASTLYAAYCDWMEKTGEGHPVTQNSFGRRLAELGYERFRSNGPCYRGIALNPGTGSTSRTENASVRSQSLTGGNSSESTNGRIMRPFQLSDLND